MPMRLLCFAAIALVYLCPFIDAQEAALQIDKTFVPTECAIKSQNGDKLAMHYTGTLDNGETFDSSRTRGQPFVFTIGRSQVIKGWDQGLLDMCLGEKRILTIPSDMAYGDRGYPPVIPAGATLTFDVELLEIQNRKAASSAGADLGNAKKLVEDAITNNHIVIFSKSYCAWSKRAKNAIAAVPIKKSDPKIFELDLLGSEGEAIQAYLQLKTSQKTVPNVFIGGKHIGGSDAIAALQENGNLEKLCIGSNSQTTFYVLLGGIAVLVAVGARMLFGGKSPSDVKSR